MVRVKSVAREIATLIMTKKKLRLVKRFDAKVHSEIVQFMALVGFC